MRLNSNESSRTRLLDSHEGQQAIQRTKENNDNRRKVTLDPGLMDDLLNFSDEEIDDQNDDLEGLSRQGSLDSIISQDFNEKSAKDSSQNSSPDKSHKRGHQRRHSLTVCETPVFGSFDDKRVYYEPPLDQQRKKPPMFETQISTLSSNLSSGSVTPTSDPGTPKFEDEIEDENLTLAPDSIAQMQARLHAEFLQSVSCFLVPYLCFSVSIIKVF